MLWTLIAFLLQVPPVSQNVAQNLSTQAARPEPSTPEGAVLASSKGPTATAGKPEPASQPGLRDPDPVLMSAAILPRESPLLPFDEPILLAPTLPYAQPGAIASLTASTSVADPAPFLVAETSPRTPRLWYALTAATHGAALFDAWTTRRVIRSGAGHEANPLFKPFANSGLLYPAVQVAPVALDYLGRRLMSNRRPWVRKMWWVPQAASTTISLWGGAHNLGVCHRARTRLPQ
jgi:hypothetical protein